jgi:hypothetical protein
VPTRETKEGWIRADNGPLMNARRISAARIDSANSCGAGQYGGGWTSGTGGVDEGARTVVAGTENMCGYRERELMRLIDRWGSGPECRPN